MIQRRRDGPPVVLSYLSCELKLVASQVNTASIASDVPEISREELRNRLKSASLTIVDVLPAESYAAGHIPGAISLPLESVANRARELLPDPTAEIAVYCAKFT
jgi:3-mercaptopyruvate sulfurtransferase SseA